MSSIYDIEKELLEIEALVFVLDPDDERDNEQLELLEAKKQRLLSSAELNLEFKLRLLDEAKGFAKLVEDRKRNITKRHERAQKRVEFWKEHIIMHMQNCGIKTLKGVEWSVTLCYPAMGATIIPEGYDLMRLPPECRKEIPATVELVKKEIAKLLDNVEEVEINGMLIKESEDGLKYIRKQTIKVS